MHLFELRRFVPLRVAQRLVLRYRHGGRLDADLERGLVRRRRPRHFLGMLVLQRRRDHQRQRRRRGHRAAQSYAHRPARLAPLLPRRDRTVGVDPGRLEPQRPDVPAHFDHLTDVSAVIHLGLGACRRQDAIVEPVRRLLQLAQRRRQPAGLVEGGLLALALVAAGEMPQHLLLARGIQLAVREVEEQVLGFGVRHALPTFTSGSGSAAEASTPAASSALRRPSSA